MATSCRNFYTANPNACSCCQFVPASPNHFFFWFSTEKLGSCGDLEWQYITTQASGKQRMVAMAKRSVSYAHYLLQRMLHLAKWARTWRNIVNFPPLCFVWMCTAWLMPAFRWFTRCALYCLALLKKHTFCWDRPCGKGSDAGPAKNMLFVPIVTLARIYRDSTRSLPWSLSKTSLLIHHNTTLYFVRVNITQQCQTEDGGDVCKHNKFFLVANPNRTLMAFFKFL